MKLIQTAMIAVACSAFAANAEAADYSVKRTLQMTQPMADVWRVVGGFCDIDDWHPGVVNCEEKVIDGKLHRVLTTTGGDRFVEQRIAKEKGLSYTYKTSDAPLAVDNFVATLSIEPFNGAKVSWSASFSSDDPAMEAEVVELIETGLAGIETAFRSN